MPEQNTASPVFVSGVIRSGTTWLGRLLASCQSTVYFHEPFNPHSSWNAALPVPNRYVYLDEHNGELYRDLLHALVSLNPIFRGEKWMPEIVAGKREELRAMLEHQDPALAVSRINSRVHQVPKVLVEPMATDLPPFLLPWLTQ